MNLSLISIELIISPSFGFRGYLYIALIDRKAVLEFLENLKDSILELTDLQDPFMIMLISSSVCIKGELIHF